MKAKKDYKKKNGELRSKVETAEKDLGKCEKDLEREKKKNKDLKVELDIAKKELHDARMVSLDLTDMSQLEQQKDDLQAELENTRKENDRQLKEKDKERGSQER